MMNKVVEVQNFLISKFDGTRLGPTSFFMRNYLQNLLLQIYLNQLGSECSQSVNRSPQLGRNACQ